MLQKRAEGSCSEVTAGSGFGSQCLLLSVNKVQLFLSKCYIQMLKNRLLYSYTGSVIGNWLTAGPLKYLNICWLDCHEILNGRLWFPEDDLY